jgi:D-3-phosphoglycerate dehydrogenase
VRRVLIGDPLCGLERARAALRGLVVEEAEPPWAGEDVVGLLVGPGRPVTAADLERLPALMAIATASVGADHLDVEAARARGVRVSNVPDYCVDETADSTLALLLALLRGVVALDRSVREGRWDFAAAGPLRPLAGTRLGIVGFGRIGRAVARRASALGLDVWATDPAVPDGEIARAGAWPAPLAELLAACDAVTLHLPLERGSAPLLGPDELARMKRGAVLVNAARGGLVDVPALVDALERGHLAGAALDVLPSEPPRAAPEAATLIVTPHAAWYSPEALDRAYEGALAALRAALFTPRST